VYYAEMADPVAESMWEVQFVFEQLESCDKVHEFCLRLLWEVTLEYSYIALENIGVVSAFVIKCRGECDSAGDVSSPVVIVVIVTPCVQKLKTVLFDEGTTCFWR